MDRHRDMHIVHHFTVTGFDGSASFVSTKFLFQGRYIENEDKASKKKEKRKKEKNLTTSENLFPRMIRKFILEGGGGKFMPGLNVPHGWYYKSILFLSFPLPPATTPLVFTRKKLAFKILAPRDFRAPPRSTTKYFTNEQLCMYERREYHFHRK